MSNISKITEAVGEMWIDLPGMIMIGHDNDKIYVHIHKSYIRDYIFPKYVFMYPLEVCYEVEYPWFAKRVNNEDFEL